MSYFNKVMNLTKADGTNGAVFGAAVAASESLFVVGDYTNSENESSEGVATVYDNTGDELFTLAPADHNGSKHFGCAVAVDNDIIAVGANSESSYTGSAYIFDLDGTQVAKMQGSGTGQYDYFGSCVALNTNNIIIGAPGDSDTSGHPGYVYIFDKSGNEVKKITYNDGNADNEHFGNAVAANDSIIAVSAYNQAGGAVYVYDTDGNLSFKIKPYNITDGDGFGSNIAVTDANIIISATNINAEAGLVYIYDLTGNLITTFRSKTTEPGDYFGSSLAVLGTNIVVGARYSDLFSSDGGAVYVFDIDGSELGTLDITTPADNSRVGNSVAINSTHILYGGLDYAGFSVNSIINRKELTLSTGLNTFGNSIESAVDLSTLKTKLDVCKTLIDGSWSSWTNDAPDAYQGMLTIEPGRGYVANAISDFSFKIFGPEVDLNSVPLVLGYNMISLPDTDTLGNGYLPRMKFDSVKTIDGTWKSWTSGASDDFQGFLNIDATKGYVYNVTNLYGDVDYMNNLENGLLLLTGDTTVENDVSAGGVVLTAPDYVHKVYFNAVTYDGSTPTNVMFYNVNGEIGKLDYPSELENSKLYIEVDGKKYTTTFVDGSTYTSPATVVLAKDLTITKDEKTIAADTTYSNMNLSVDGVVYTIETAAEYLGDTFQVWKDGDMREAVFTEGDVTVTFA